MQEAPRDATAAAVEEASVPGSDASLVGTLTDAASDAAPDVVDAGRRMDAAADARAKVTPSVTLGADDDDVRIGKHGDVCQLGERSRSTPRPVFSCGPGLQCCYPCGIQGCDWVCHTPQECATDRMRP